jgi:hypothetical protein
MMNSQSGIVVAPECVECFHKSVCGKDQPNHMGEEDVIIASTNGSVTTKAAVPVVDDGKGGDVAVACGDDGAEGVAEPGIGNGNPHHSIDQKSKRRNQQWQWQAGIVEISSEQERN